MYLVVTRRGQVGSFYKEVEDGRDLAALGRALSLVEGEGVQIVPLSDLDAYQEYAPFHRVDRYDELLLRVGGLSMGLNT